MALVICIDTGHGQDSAGNGFDTGAVSGKKQEAEYAFRMTETFLYVAKIAYPEKIKIVLTRDSRTESSPLGSRVTEANREGAELLISFHLNSAGPEATGIETFYADDADKTLAKIVNDAAVKAFGLRDRGLKHQSETRHKVLAILKSTGGRIPGSPSCLAELCFITNDRDMEAVFGEDARDERINFATMVYAGVLAKYADYV